MKDLTTISGQPVSRLGLGGAPDMETRCVPTAWKAGVNCFFLYNLDCDGLIDPLRELLRQHRNEIIIATGTVARAAQSIAAAHDEATRRLGVETIDAFFVEYLNPDDDLHTLLAPGGVFDQLADWRRDGRIRYIGASCHDRGLALRLSASGRIDVLMHRYNMAHRGAEEQVLPAAIANGVPVVAFTATRWGTLLAGHPGWRSPVPSAADCYRFTLLHPAVRLALTAPRNVAQLGDNLAALDGLAPTAGQIEDWRAYGRLVHGDGTGAFDTDWP